MQDVQKVVRDYQLSKKSYKITKNSEYKKILYNSDKFYTKNIIFYKKTNSFSYSRFGVVASKKIGNAVERNYAKRVIRSIYNQLDVPTNYDFIFIAKKNILNSNYSDVTADFIRFFKNIK